MTPFTAAVVVVAAAVLLVAIVGGLLVYVDQKAHARGVAETLAEARGDELDRRDKERAALDQARADRVEADAAVDRLDSDGVDGLLSFGDDAPAASS